MDRLLQLRDGTVDLLSGVVRRGDAEARLSSMELQMLAYLAERPGEAVSREQLLTDVWGYAEGVRSRTADTTMVRLRKKIEVDPSDPHMLVTVVGEGYRFVPPRRQAPPTNLPAAEPACVGRDELLATLDDLLEDGVRLITLVGPGGVGKTTVARAWAIRHRGDHAAGAWFCSLEGCVERQEIESAVANVLGVDDPVTGLDAGGPLLVVLDNAEDAADALAPLLANWVQQAPRTRLVLTSRVPIEAAGEHRLAVEPLAPEDAERLLQDRGRAARAGWRPTPDDREALAAIARALDGLPLALELAGARLKLLSPRQIRDRLDERFALLRQGDTTLEATLDWAWQRLAPAEQELLVQITVFEGGCSVTGVEGVLGVGVDALEPLIDASLLQVEATDPVRLHLLENVRAFVRQQAGEPPSGVRGAHFDWYLAQAEEQKQAPGGRAWLRRERANLLAAHRWALEADPVRAGRLLRAAIRVLGTGPMRRSLELIDRTLDALGERVPGLRAHLYERRAAFEGNLDRMDRSRRDLRRGLALAERAGEREVLARLLARAAHYGDVLDEPAEATWERAHALAREVDDPSSLWVLLSSRASDVFREGRVEEACRLLAEAAAVAERAPGLEGYHGVALTQWALGLIDLGRHGEAEQMLRHAERTAVDRGSVAGIAWVAQARGYTALDRHDLDEARRLLEACQPDLEGTTHHLVVAYAQRDLSAVHLLGGDREAALTPALDAVDRLKGLSVVATAHVLVALATDAASERAHHLERAREAAGDLAMRYAVVGALTGEPVEARWRERSVLVRVAERLPPAIRIG